MFFTSLALQPFTSNLYKIFSRLKLTKTQLDLLFLNNNNNNNNNNSDYTILYEIPWKAYPHYQPARANELFVPFEVLGNDDNSNNSSEGLYYTSPLEMGAAAMEISAIAGRNIANLIIHKYKIQS